MTRKIVVYDDELLSHAPIEAGDAAFATVAEVKAGADDSKPINAEVAAQTAQSGAWLYAVAGGTAVALTASLTPPLLAYSAGLMLRIDVTAINPGAATLNVDGLGAKSITRVDGASLMIGDLIPPQIALLIYDGTRFLLMNPAASPLNVRTIKYSTALSSSWVVPNGVYGARVRVWGGGGGGGGGATGQIVAAGEGGGSGGYSEGWFAVTPAQVVSITVGAGGAGGAPQGNGGNGGNSSFGGVCTASGGAGGRYVTMSTTAARSGGVGAGGVRVMQGGYGGIIIPNGTSALGGSGGGAPLGAPAGCNSVGAPSASLTPGGGGGGAGGPDGLAGQAGASGQIIIEY